MCSGPRRLQPHSALCCFLCAGTRGTFLNRGGGLALHGLHPQLHTWPAQKESPKHVPKEPQEGKRGKAQNIRLSKLSFKWKYVARSGYFLSYLWDMGVFHERVNSPLPLADRSLLLDDVSSFTIPQMLTSPATKSYHLLEMLSCFSFHSLLTHWFLCHSIAILKSGFSLR